MGYYINPTDGLTKEEWLMKFGERKDGVVQQEVDTWNEIPENCLAVCLVDNGPFTAAAIAYKESEFEVFKDNTNDDRPKTWFLVEKEMLEEFLEGAD